MDLSEVLSKLSPDPVEVDFDNYTDASEFPPPIPEGIYTFQQGKPDFSVTDKGFLSANMTHVALDDTGKEVGKLSFDRISDKPFDRSGTKVSMMADHVRALGTGERPRTHQEFATILAASEGKPFKGQVGWEGYCGHKGTPHEVQDSKQGYTVKSARNFGSNGNGQPNESIPCPVCGSEVRARARITRRIPAGQ